MTVRHGVPHWPCHTCHQVTLYVRLAAVILTEAGEIDNWSYQKSCAAGKSARADQLRLRGVEREHVTNDRKVTGPYQRVWLSFPVLGYTGLRHCF